MAPRRRVQEGDGEGVELVEELDFSALADDERARAQAAVGDIALLDDPLYSTVKWSCWRVRSDAEKRGDPDGQALEYVGSRLGAIDTAEFQRDFGGGTFELRGYVTRYDDVGNNKGAVCKYRPKVTIAAPRRNFAEPVKALPEPATAAVGTTDPTIARLLERLIDRVDQIERNANKGGLAETLSGLATLDALRDRNAPKVQPFGMPEMLGMVQTILGMVPSAGGKDPDPVKVAAMMLETLTKGIEIGQAREPITVEGDGKTDYGPVLEKGLEIVSQLLTKNRGQRPPPPPPPPPGPNGAPPHTPSEARVVETEVVTPPTQPTAAMHRWMTATEALYRAMLNRVDPADFADTLEQGSSLNEEELDQMRNSSVELVRGYLAPLLAQYPDLETEQGKVYLTAVLAALRDGGEDEPDGTPAAE